MHQSLPQPDAVERAVAQLGPLEAQVMRIAWTAEEVSVRDVLAQLDSSPPHAYTTIMTIMARLASKGLLTREPRGKAYVYRPSVTPNEWLATLACERVTALLEDFGDVAIAAFLGRVASTDPARLEALRNYVADRRTADE